MQNYAKYRSYTVSPPPSASYPDSGVELSDNRDVTAVATNPLWVGWSSGSPEIILDLGVNRTVKRVRLLALKATGSSLNVPSNIVVETGVSASGPWTNFGSLAPSAGLADNAAHYLSVDKLAGQTDRFIRVTLTRNGATTALLAEVQAWDDALPILLDLPEDYSPCGSSLNEPLPLLSPPVSMTTPTSSLIGNLLASQGVVYNVSSEFLPPLVTPVSTATTLIGLINASTGARIVSQTESYENGFLKIDFVLDKLAGISAWLRLGNQLISDVYDSFTPSLNHTLRIPVARFDTDREIIVVTEIVNF